MLQLLVYRFCGIREPHNSHTFYRDIFGTWAGASNYECIGWMPAEMRADHV